MNQPPVNQPVPEDLDAQVQQITAMAMSILHNGSNKIEENQLPTAYQQAMQSAQHQEDAGPKAVADVALWIFTQIEAQIQSRGKNFKPVVLLGAVGTIVEQVAEVAVAAGLFEMSEEDIQVAAATAINLYVSKAKQEGRLTDQELQEAAQALQQQHPGEVENFQKMISARQQRQQGAQPEPKGLLRG